MKTTRPRTCSSQPDAKTNHAVLSRRKTGGLTWRARHVLIGFLFAWSVCGSSESQAVPSAESKAEVHEHQKTASAPPAWKAQIFSDQVKNATSLCVDDVGKIYVSETYRWREGIEDNRNHTYWIMDDLACETVGDRSRMQQKWKDKFQRADYFTHFSDRVVRLEDSDQDGQAETYREFATGFNEDVAGPAIGLLAGERGIYLTCIPHLWLLQDVNGDGQAEERLSLQDGFGVKTSLAGHDLHGLAWGPDGKLYFSMGDRGFHCITREGKTLKDTNSGAVFRCNPDGSDLEIFYHQLRNPQELAFNELGDLFTVDNNCDQGDSARVCYLLEGGTSGWHLGGQALTTYAPYIDDGGMKQPPNWLAEGVWKLRFTEQPAHILPPVAHLTNGPSGLVYHSGLGFSPRYRNHFLVCDYRGAPNLSFLYSFKVQPDQAGYAMHDAHMVRGGVANTDVEVGYDGKIYLADFGGGWYRSDRGNIITLSDPEHLADPAVAELKSRFSKGFRAETNEQLVAMLAHDDMRIRLRCQYELAQRAVAARPALLSVLIESRIPVAKYHAVWALGQMRDAATLMNFAKSPEPELRAQIARTLGNIDDKKAIPTLRPMLRDSSPRVRTFAAIGLSTLDDRDSFPAIVAMVQRNDNRDAYERHAGVLALSRLGTSAQIVDLSNHESQAVRLAAVLALRRQRHSGVGQFLDDADAQVVNEAVRAINDEFIDDALPALVAFTSRFADQKATLLATPNEPVFRRLVNSALRLGRPEDAILLVRLAAQANLPLNYRLIAFKALERFDRPAPIDATLGLYHPLPPRDKAGISAAVEGPLRVLFQQSTGVLAAGAIQVMDHFQLRLADDELIQRVRDARQPTVVRLVALRQLVDAKRVDQKDLLRSLVVDERVGVRSAAAEFFAKAFPDEAVSAIRDLLSMGYDEDLRTAFRLLAENDSIEARTLFIEQLDTMQRGNLYLTVRLDLFEAARQHPHPSVTAKLAEVESDLAKQGIVTPDDFMLEGGNPTAGRLVFQNQGVCMKCHRGDEGGGNAGPPLSNIGRLRRTEELLQSIREPNAVVVPGYGTRTVYLVDGTSVMGTPIEETAELLTLRTETGDLRQIRRQDVDELSPLTSPMPQPAETLTRQELRDLIAYLHSLHGRDEDAEPTH